MKAISISNSRDLAAQAVNQIQESLTAKGFEEVGNYVFLREVGGMWIVQVIPQVIEILNWTLHLDIDAQLAAQGYCL